MMDIIWRPPRLERHEQEKDVSIVKGHVMNVLDGLIVHRLSGPSISWHKKFSDDNQNFEPIMMTLRHPASHAK